MSSKRILYVVRHAKSSWDYDEISDFDRHLKIKGIRDAYDMARRQKIERELPELIISSPAARAIHTATIFMRVFEHEFSRLKVDGRIYGGGVSVLKKIIAEQDSEIKRLMIFGHNPDFSELATLLSGSSYIDMPTCGLCKITFDVPSWDAISSSNHSDLNLDFPKKT